MNPNAIFFRIFTCLGFIFVVTLGRYEVRAMGLNSVKTVISEDEITFLNKIIKFTDDLCAAGDTGRVLRDQIFCERNNFIPVITHIEYLKRIARYAFIDFEEFKNILIIALIYIDRLIKEYTLENFDDVYIFNSRSFHRIIVTAIIISTKFNSDTFYEDIYYARVAGVSMAVLVKIEVDFLNLIDFDLSVSPEEFEKKMKEIEAENERN